MAEKFKSVLEKYDAKGNRRLPTPEEDAIQPDTTLEEFLIGPGKALASTVKNAINKKAQLRKFDAPEIGSNVPPSGLDPWRNVGFNKSPREILAEQEAKSNKGLMLKAAERATGKGTRRLYGELGSEIVEQKMNAAGDTYKKGGKVSSASSRADGIAKRGKTKGRYL
jgi:hypothetical protein